MSRGKQNLDAEAESEAPKRKRGSGSGSEIHRFQFHGSRSQMGKIEAEIRVEIRQDT